MNHADRRVTGGGASDRYLTGGVEVFYIAENIGVTDTLSPYIGATLATAVQQVG